MPRVVALSRRPRNHGTFRRQIRHISDASWTPPVAPAAEMARPLPCSGRSGRARMIRWRGTPCVGCRLPVPRLLCCNGTFRHSGSLNLRKSRKLSREARQQLAARRRDAMRRRIEAGLYMPPTKDPTVAAKVRLAQLIRIKEEVEAAAPRPTEMQRLASGRKSRRYLSCSFTAVGRGGQLGCLWCGFGRHPAAPRGSGWRCRHRARPSRFSCACFRNTPKCGRPRRGSSPWWAGRGTGKTYLGAHWGWKRVTERPTDAFRAGGWQIPRLL